MLCHLPDILCLVALRKMTATTKKNIFLPVILQLIVNHLWGMTFRTNIKYFDSNESEKNHVQTYQILFGTD